MQINPHIFREYDIRGVVAVDFAGSVPELVGRAYGSEVRRACAEVAQPTVVLGRDNRPSSPDLAEKMMRGIRAAGVRVIDVGTVPTPVLYWAVLRYGADGGLQITGSHNPPEYNGFKMVLRGASVYGAAIQGLRERIEQDGFATGQGDMERRDPLPEYVDDVAGRFHLQRPVKVVVDCGNGVTSLVAIETLRDLGCDVVPLFAESDGTFPNHHPDPTVVENLHDLQAAVAREGAELGIAFDGDGDRIGAVDECGTPVFGDTLLILFGRDLAQRMGTGYPVIFDVKCSEVLPQELKRAGLVPTMWKTGHSLIKQKMKEIHAPLAGEMSGHVFFGGDWFGFDDALFAAARLLQYVSRVGGPLSRLLADLPPTVSTPELRVDCPDDVKFGLVERAAQYFAAKYPVFTLDGVRITFAEGWGLLRASNTQPVLVLRFEARTPEALAAYRSEVEGWLARNSGRP